MIVCFNAIQKSSSPRFRPKQFLTFHPASASLLNLIEHCLHGMDAVPNRAKLPHRKRPTCGRCSDERGQVLAISKSSGAAGGSGPPSHPAIPARAKRRATDFLAPDRPYPRGLASEQLHSPLPSARRPKCGRRESCRRRPHPRARHPELPPRKPPPLPSRKVFRAQEPLPQPQGAAGPDPERASVRTK